MKRQVSKRLCRKSCDTQDTDTSDCCQWGVGFAFGVSEFGSRGLAKQILGARCRGADHCRLHWRSIPLDRQKPSGRDCMTCLRKIYKPAFMCAYIYIYILIHTYMHVYEYVYVCVCRYVHPHLHLHTIYTHLHTYMHACMHIYIYIYIYMYPYIEHTYMCIYIYI